jgi:NDP-sugar pyrophosphorylase family protein
MKAIILAAGEGKRMRPLTLQKPKPMLEVLGKPLLHWIIESLPSEITELIIVIGYKGGAIKAYFGERFEGRSITYVVQERAEGTAHALFLCKPHLAPGEKFLFLFADDLHSKEALEKLIAHPLAVLVREHNNPSRFGVVTAALDGTVLAIEEKPLNPKTNLVVVGVYVFDDRIFRYELVKHERLHEYFVPDLVTQLIAEHRMVVEKSDFWHPIGFPDDLDEAEEVLLARHPNLKRASRGEWIVLLAGGKGTRMPEDSKHLPKALVEVAGKPILEHQLDWIGRQGFSRVRLSLGWKADQIIAWLKERGYMHVEYVVESEPLGTGGGLKLASRGITEPFIALNADNLADWNFRGMLRHAAGGVFSVIAGVEVPDARDYGTLECDASRHIRSFREKQPEVEKGMVNAGAYVLNPQDLEGMPHAFSMEKDIFPKLAASGRLVLHRHSGSYWFDCGTPERLKAVQEHFQK